MGYRYRHFDLGNGINLLVRCEVDAIMPKRTDEEKAKEKGKDEGGAGSNPDAPKFCCIKALNEFDSRVSGLLIHVPS